MSPEELAASYRRQAMETTRRSIALRRLYPGCVVQFRRAAPTGPNSVLALILVLHPGAICPDVELWPYERIERLAAAVTDEEVASTMRERFFAKGEE